MTVNNWPKLILMLVLLVGMFVLILAGETSLGDVDKYFTLIGGYIIGNGIAAKRDEPVQPVLARKGKTDGSNYR